MDPKIVPGVPRQSLERVPNSDGKNFLKLRKLKSEKSLGGKTAYSSLNQFRKKKAE